MHNKLCRTDLAVHLDFWGERLWGGGECVEGVIVGEGGCGGDGVLRVGVEQDGFGDKGGPSPVGSAVQSCCPEGSHSNAEWRTCGGSLMILSVNLSACCTCMCARVLTGRPRILQCTETVLCSQFLFWRLMV